VNNRDKQSLSATFIPAIKVLMACGVAGAIGVGYLWQQKQIHVLADTKKSYEKELQRLRGKNQALRSDLDHLRLVPAIESRVKQMNLGLVPAQPEQIVRLVEVSSTPPGIAFPPRTSRTVPENNAPARGRR
jgi:hypothetical protein